jgi:ribonuclease HI
MWGIIQGLLAIIQHRHFIKSDSIMLTVYSDSDYSVSMFSRKWSLKPKSKNRDLIEMSYGLVIQLNALGVTTDFRWVRGHADNQYNNMADEAANRMLKTTLIESTHSYTQGTL